MNCERKSGPGFAMLKTALIICQDCGGRIVVSKRYLDIMSDLESLERVRNYIVCQPCLISGNSSARISMLGTVAQKINEADDTTTEEKSTYGEEDTMSYQYKNDGLEESAEQNTGPYWSRLNAILGKPGRR